jgi:hypothetical protein
MYFDLYIVITCVGSYMNFMNWVETKMVDSAHTHRKIERHTQSFIEHPKETSQLVV